MIPIRIWLSETHIETRLRRLSQMLALFGLLGITGTAGILILNNWEVTSARDALDAQKQQVGSLSSQLTGQRKTSLLLKAVDLRAPYSGGSMAMAVAFNALLPPGEGRRQSLHFLPTDPGAATKGRSTPGSGGMAPGAASSVPASGSGSPQAPGSPTPSDPSGATSTTEQNGEWSQQPFECDCTGTFADLTYFQEQLAHVPQVIEVSHLELARSNVDTRHNAIQVTLHLRGMLYGLTEKTAP